jgi:predicted TIM-barrel enzyme
MTLAAAPAAVQAIGEAAWAVNGDAFLLCHGGPIATPDDARFILAHCPECHGFYGASSMERLPAEVALTQTTQRFAQIKRPQGVQP